MKFNNKKSKEYRLPCVNCDNKTYHKVLSSIEEEEEYDGVWYFNDFQIIMCQGCKRISFRSNWKSTDEICGDIHNPIFIDHEELYPKRIIDRKELKNKYDLPQNIRKIYEEIHLALCSGMYTLAGAGVRILVELVCNDKKVRGNSLDKKINNLVDDDILTKNGSEILHRVRLLGNKVIHGKDNFGEKTLKEAMIVVEQLLTTIYIIPKNIGNLPIKDR